VFRAFCGRGGYIMETDKSDERVNETERNGKGKKELVESTCRMSDVGYLLALVSLSP
jgi:hypothetical protein